MGPGFGAGPLETTRDTVLPRGRTVPAAGEALRTVPAGMVGSDFSVVAGWRPAARTAASASARSIPTSPAGTVAVVGAAVVGVLVGVGAVVDVAATVGAGVPTFARGGNATAVLPAMTAPPGASGYVLGTGDKIKITVFGVDDLSGEYTVDSEGTIRMPLIGQVQATGLTGPQLENSIGSALANGFLRSPRVSTQITTYRPFYVVGAVNRPGEYPYGINMTALKAVALAGGFQEHAVESTVYVRHQDQTEEHEMPTDRLSQIQPGDTVRVKKSLFWDAIDVFGPISGTAALAAAIN